MDPRYIHRIFYIIAATLWFLLLLSRDPNLIFALVCISIVSMAVGNFVRTVRREAELGIERSPWSSMMADALTEDLRRIVTDELIKAVGSVELIGRRLRDDLKSSPKSAPNPEIYRELTAWLDLARRDLAQARAKLNELTGRTS